MERKPSWAGVEEELVGSEGETAEGARVDGEGVRPSGLLGRHWTRTACRKRKTKNRRVA